MVKDNYSLLDEINIEDCELIKTNYSMISSFCLRNKINTLGELVRKYKSSEVVVRNRKSKEEMDGFIELIEYVYYGERLPKEYLLFDEIVILTDSWQGKYWAGRCEADFNNSQYYNPLKRLGFNSDESDSIIYFVERTRKDTTIINALINYNSGDYKWFTGSANINREIITRKIEIFIEYYNKYLKCNDYFDEYKSLEFEEILVLYRDKKEELLKVLNELREFRKKIELKSQFVSEEKREQIIKRYNYKMYSGERNEK